MKVEEMKEEGKVGKRERGREDEERRTRKEEIKGRVEMKVVRETK